MNGAQILNDRKENLIQQKRNQQAEICLGSHGEDYGSWMSNPVFYMIGSITALAVVLAALSFSVFHITALGVLFSVVAAALMALLVWITWIRLQYAFGGGGIMEQIRLFETLPDSVRTQLDEWNYGGYLRGEYYNLACAQSRLCLLYTSRCV